MLFGALVRGPLLYVPNVGAQPEPPVRFNVNVQGLVGVLRPRDRAPKTDLLAESQRPGREGNAARRWPTRPRRSTACSSTTSSRIDADRARHGISCS